MTELLETRFFALLARESFEEITKEDLEDELGKFVQEVAGLCDLGDDYLSTCRALHIPVDTRSAFPVISVQSPVSIQYRWQS